MNNYIEKYKELISIGHRCTSQMAINSFYKKKQIASPFSYVNNFNINNIFNIINNEFSTYLENSVSGDYYLEKNLDKKNGSGFGHYDLNDNKIIESFNRKIIRFNNILNDKHNKYLLIYINEDYLYNEDYRNNNEINYNNLKKFNDLLLKKYPYFNFDILNISFKLRNNYKNIINIFYDIKFNLIFRKDWIKNFILRSKIEKKFRSDCSKILKNYLINI